MITLDVVELVESIKKHTKEEEQPDRILTICQISMLMTMAQTLAEIRDSLKEIENKMIIK